MKQKRGCEVIRVVMYPCDANSNVVNGKMQIFGGKVMCYMDQAAGEAARSICRNPVVTVCFKTIEFRKPVFVGDLLECHAQVTKVGNTSITVQVVVHVIRKNQRLHVTDGEAIFVSVDENLSPIPVIGWDFKRPVIRGNAKPCEPNDGRSSDETATSASGKSGTASGEASPAQNDSEKKSAKRRSRGSSCG